MTSTIKNNTKNELPPNGTFIGEDEDTNNVITIAVLVFSSTNGTLIIKQTDDKVTYPINISYTIKAGERILYGQPVVKKYFHVEFRNNESVSQSYLLVNTVLYTNYIQDSNIKYNSI